MYILIHKLIELLNKYESIAIYGAGKYAKSIFSIFERLGYKEKVQSFIVSKQQDNNVLEDKEIVPLQEFKCNKDQCLIFVAVRKQYVDAIEKNLKEREFPHIAYMVDYLSVEDDEKRAELFRNSTFEECCKYIADWYVCTNIEQIKRYKEIQDQLMEKGRKKSKFPVKRDLITVIVGHINGRTVKIVNALKKKGYKVDIIQLQNDIPAYVGESELVSYGINWEKCSCIEEILYEVLQRNPLLFYVEAPYTNAAIAEIMLRHKEKFGKIVYTAYDICHGTYIGMPDSRYDSEKYVLENADGIVWRYYSVDFIQKTFGIKYAGKMVHFSDCCDDYDIVRTKKKDPIIKLCSLPTHVSEDLKNIPNSNYVYTSTLEEILQKIGNRDDCCYHAFYWNVTESEKKQLEVLEQKYKNFKFFYHIEHLKLMKIISEYDYGCSLWSGDTIPEWPETENGIGTILHTEGAFRYGMSNKFFDFLSVGLPVVTTLPQVMADKLAKLGVAIKMDLETFDLVYLKEHREEYRERVWQIRKEYLVDNQIWKLIHFFQEVSDAK